MHRDGIYSGNALTAVLIEWAAMAAVLIAVAASDSISGAIGAGALLVAVHFGASSIERWVGLWTHAGSAATAAASLIFIAVWAGFGLTAGLWLLAALAGLLVVSGASALLWRRPDDGSAHAHERDASAEPVQHSGRLVPPPAVAHDAPASREESSAPNLRSKPSEAPSRTTSHTPAPQAAAIRTSSDGSDMAWIANLTWITLRTMRDLPQPAHNYEIDDAVAVAMDVSVAARLHMRSQREGRTEWGYRVGWARSALHNRGWIERPTDGWWRVSSRGTTASEADVTTHARQYFATKRGLKDYSPAPLPDLKDGDAELQPGSPAPPTAEQQLTAQLWSLAPVCFEELCAELLRLDGYRDVSVIGGRGDDGIDVLAELRESADPATVYVQCKAWRGEVGVEVVREFRQALNRRDQRGRPGHGRLMTTGHFSREAITEARQGGTPLDLIDGNRICALLANLDGIVIEWTDELEVNRRWFDEFAQNCRAGDRYRNQAGPPTPPPQPDPQ